MAGESNSSNTEWTGQGSMERQHQDNQIGCFLTDKLSPNQEKTGWGQEVTRNSSVNLRLEDKRDFETESRG